MISIITPTYNRAHLISNTIQSVLAQTNKDWELIIVDDGSTDNTEEVVQAFLSDNRIKYFRKENTGASHTRNIGVTYAKGDFITFLDSDDEALPNWLETIKQHLKHDSGIITFGAVKKYPDGHTIEEYPYYITLFEHREKVRFTSLVLKRSLFNQINGFDNNLKSSQFTDLLFRLFDHIRKTELKLVSINELLVQVNIHEGERIRTNWKSVREGGIQFLDKHLNHFLEYDKRGLSNIYGSIAFSNYKLKRKKDSLYYLLKSIKYNPQRMANYLKLVKYAFL